MNELEDCSDRDSESDRECDRECDKFPDDTVASEPLIEAEIGWYWFDRRWVTMRRLINGGLTVGISAAGFAGTFVLLHQAPFLSDFYWLILIGVSVLAVGIVVAGYRFPRMAFERMRFRRSPLGLEIQRGILWRHRLAIPVSRIQHADVAQGPLERRFGLGRLVIYTAGTSHSAVELQALSLDVASRLRDSILSGRGIIDGV